MPIKYRHSIPYKRGTPEYSMAMSEITRGIPKSSERREQMRQVWVGRKHKPESKEKIRLARLGTKMSLETRLKKSEAEKGEKNHQWKGGVTARDRVIRRSLPYRMWRKSVKERDGFTCQMCGKKDGELHADHIKPFSLFPGLRFEITNGRTLCRPCHLSLPTHGRQSYRNAIE